jgi:hypothetical protein
MRDTHVSGRFDCETADKAAGEFVPNVASHVF